jgi:hypothetical protein
MNFWTIFFSDGLETIPFWWGVYFYAWCIFWFALAVIILEWKNWEIDLKGRLDD